MRRIQQLLPVGITLLALLSWLVIMRPGPVQAEAAVIPSLIISQLKITSNNGQFITLFNTTDTSLDMSRYQLQYFNHYDLNKATSSRLISLTGTIPPHGYYMVNDSALLLCYQLTVNSVSLGLSSTAGLVQVLSFNQTTPGSSITPLLQDYVGWSKTSANGAQILPTNPNASLYRLPIGAGNHPAITVPGMGSWQPVQPDSTNPCNMVTTTTLSTAVATGLNLLLPPVEPPATITYLSAEALDQTPVRVMPPGNIGLIAPQITELLPNPSGTGNDNEEEFIELYNANDKAFDLTGFSLQVGTTTLRFYNFPAGTSLAPRSFTVFYATDTKLSLSNSGSQVKLLDPFENSISGTELYSAAKDGQGWALAKGKWHWTVKLTPKAANIIELPPSSKKTAAKKTTTKKGSAVSKTAATTKPHATPAASSGWSDLTATSPIHPRTLALVAGGALLYGAYEYRTDLANRIYLLRRYFGTRRADRK